ncbi:MAG: hypothetical protein KME32_04720 [Mojavia pulchra JT2-VF2]|jgi:hypothetical protein|uniref:Uncharacterized protein n=1 Tax=Mojavia pulchra JT2-VF2 TaxID=287848 RepID=A0A951PX46_9NOST|nr:hypothetical protein [Mojavia pulchra JT2-VF2]
MPNRHYPPAYLRYLKARLWNLGRPGFWGTAIFLSVFGLGIWQYWSNPKIFTHKQNHEVASPNVAESSLSVEDRAIAADIDNLPILIKEFEQAALAASLSIPEENSQANKSQSLFQDVLSKQQSSGNDTKSNLGLGIVNTTSTPKENNLFVLQANNLLQMGSGYINGYLLDTKSLTAFSEPTATATTSFTQGVGLANQIGNSQNPATISPLQAALNQSPYPNFSGLNNATSSPTNIMGSASYGTATPTPPNNGLSSQTLPPNTGLPQNSYTNFNNSQALPTGIQAAPVTPPVTSAATTNITPYSLQTPSQGVLTPTTPAEYGNYWQQQPTQLPQSKPSLPRPTPGPYGGVQINGYTYP